MTFLDLVAGDAVFLDANTFVYHFAPDPRWGYGAGPASQIAYIHTSLASTSSSGSGQPPNMAT
jgi:hypothetical protein